MNTGFKIIAATLLAAPMVGLGLPAAAAESPQAAATERMCDYCDDYTDAATSAGKVHTAYQAGIGYAAISEKRAAALVGPGQGSTSLQILSSRIDNK